MKGRPRVRYTTMQATGGVVAGCVFFRFMVVLDQSPEGSSAPVVLQILFDFGVKPIRRKSSYSGHYGCCNGEMDWRGRKAP
jgi:hypothetical protein